MQVTNAKGHSTKYKYDTMNRLTEVHQQNSCLDTALDSVIAKDLITAYKYNNRGRLIQEINAKNQVTYFTYDAVGNLVEKEDRDGYKTQFAYDAVNNLQTVKYADGRQIDYTHDAVGRVVSMLDWLGETTYERDVLGRITKVVDHNNAVVRYKWGLLDERQELGYPNGDKVKYSYDVMGRLAKVSAGNDITTYTYNQMGSIVKEQLPNGITSQYTYDPLSRITALTHFDAKKQTLDKRELTYDARGNKTQVAIRENTPSLGSFQEHTGIYDYAYDALNQLVEVKAPRGAVERYVYDSLGNRITKTMTGDKKLKVEYAYDELNRLVEIKGKGEEIVGVALQDTARLDYDNRGNLTRVYEQGKTIAKYTYDSAERLIHTQTHADVSASYLYNGAGQRTRKEIDGEHYSYIVDVTSPFNNVLTANKEAFIYGNGRVGVSGNVYLHDEMGSTIRVMNAKGESLSRYASDVFGNAKLSEKSSLIGFTGYEDDTGTGLQFVQARYYMSEIGRFTSQDPKKGYLESPFSMNPYIHCLNNPVRYVDLDGNECVDTIALREAQYRAQARGNANTVAPVGNAECADTKAARNAAYSAQMQAQAAALPIISASDIGQAPFLSQPRIVGTGSYDVSVRRSFGNGWALTQTETRQYYVGFTRSFRSYDAAVAATLESRRRPEGYGDIGLPVEPWQFRIIRDNNTNEYWFLCVAHTPIYPLVGMPNVHSVDELGELSTNGEAVAQMDMEDVFLALLIPRWTTAQVLNSDTLNTDVNRSLMRIFHGLMMSQDVGTRRHIEMLFNINIASYNPDPLLPVIHRDSTRIWLNRIGTVAGYVAIVALVVTGVGKPAAIKVAKVVGSAARGTSAIVSMVEAVLDGNHFSAVVIGLVEWKLPDIIGKRGFSPYDNVQSILLSGRNITRNQRRIGMILILSLYQIEKDAFGAISSDMQSLANMFQEWAGVLPGSGNPEITPDDIKGFFDLRIVELDNG